MKKGGSVLRYFNVLAGQSWRVRARVNASRGPAAAESSMGKPVSASASFPSSLLYFFRSLRKSGARASSTSVNPEVQKPPMEGQESERRETGCSVILFRDGEDRGSKLKPVSLLR